MSEEKIEDRSEVLPGQLPPDNYMGKSVPKPPTPWTYNDFLRHMAEGAQVSPPAAPWGLADSLPAADMTSLLGVRNPVLEEKVHQLLLAAVQSAYIWALLSRNQESQRLLSNLAITLADPLKWKYISDIIWGSVIPVS